MSESARNGSITRPIQTEAVDLILAPDGTTVLLKPDQNRRVLHMWCGGDDAHCDADGWCEHTRELASVQCVPVELVPRRLGRKEPATP